MNEDVVAAAPTGDAPTTSEWSASLLPIKARIMFDGISISEEYAW